MRGLRIRAAGHGCSMEEEVRSILRSTLEPLPPPPKNLAEAIHSQFAAIGGWEMELPPREPMRDPPTFD